MNVDVNLPHENKAKRFNMKCVEPHMNSNKKKGEQEVLWSAVKGNIFKNDALFFKDCARRA